MNEAKIIFSAPEMELMKDATFILTKNIVMQKMKNVLEGIQNELFVSIDQLKTDTDKNIFLTPPKVSKGENYLGLPYLILDYPRKFAGPDIFAIRSFFWWGNFFSSTLHLAGDDKKSNLTNIIMSYKELANANYFIGVNPDPWQHHFEKNNYLLINEIPIEKFSELCNAHNHLKISIKWTLDDMETATEKIKESWRFLLGCIY
ncbi:MAG: hypothetical protein H0V91_11805 [Flavisolibacter sp.]|nr:hypothetical protein [Flavisolibacter sp.]